LKDTTRIASIHEKYRGFLRCGRLRSSVSELQVPTSGPDRLFGFQLASWRHIALGTFDTEFLDDTGFVLLE
jgi:hypothetical protein